TVLSFCPRKRRRAMIQAGGMNGLWALRFAEHFERVLTFEPEPLLFDCHHRNTHMVGNIIRQHAALGEAPGRCSMNFKSLGSHTVIPGDTVDVITIDSLGLEDLDLLQLDLEGYEAKAIAGAEATIDRCKPLIQLEWIGFTANYGDDPDLFAMRLAAMGYEKIANIKGGDILLRHRSQR
ncbi:MAG: FkbM family methyltransferase, partial [Solimonas sp.]